MLTDPKRMNEEQKLTSRSVRSFVLRSGRTTRAQLRAIRDGWSEFGIEYQETVIEWEKHYRRSAPMWVEIGFGNGEQTAHMAELYPDVNFLGIEVHLPGVGRLLNLTEQKQLKNLRIIRHDAVEVLQHCIADNSIDRILLFFPDPWPKKKHHKRRIIQKSFVELVGKKLKPNGFLHMATDWGEYAEWMLDTIGENTAFINLSPGGENIAAPQYRLRTRFEKRGLNKGHGVWDLLFQKSERIMSAHRGRIKQQKL